ncbi:MAG: hypothetical protein ACLPX9_20900 [Rhodomicrobium sp.]
MSRRTRDRGSAGYTFPLMLVILVAFAYGAGRLEQTQSYRLKRDKEEELLFRGLEYQKAIRAFEAFGSTEKRYPRNLDELVSDPRSNGRRFIRQLYKDPITGRDFEPIVTPAGTISGVVSASRDIPLRKVGFDKELKGFDKAKSYNDWRFDAKAKMAVPQGSRPGSPLPRAPESPLPGAPESPPPPSSPVPY